MQPSGNRHDVYRQNLTLTLTADEEVHSYQSTDVRPCDHWMMSSKGRGEEGRKRREEERKEEERREGKGREEESQEKEKEKEKNGEKMRK